jgi:hypothetical protein
VLPLELAVLFVGVVVAQTAGVSCNRRGG